MFRRSASLAILHLKSFAAIPSVSLVRLGHTNRNVFLSHESQREIALVEALSRPIPCCQKEKWGKQNGSVFRNVCVFYRATRIRIRIAAESRDTTPLIGQNKNTANGNTASEN